MILKLFHNPTNLNVFSKNKYSACSSYLVLWQLHLEKFHGSDLNLGILDTSVETLK